MMDRFDRYVLRAFLAHWLVVGVAFLGLFTGLDALAKSDELSRADELFGLGMADVARYYALNLPFLLLEFAPYITLLSGLGTVMQFLRNREWAPVLAAGRPTWRAFLPIFGAAAVIGVSLLLVRETVTPQLLAEREALASRLFEQRRWRPEELWARGADDARLRAERYLPAAGERAGEAPRLEGLQVHLQDGAPGGDEVVTARAAVWRGHEWILEEGRRIRADGEGPLRAFRHEGLAPRDLERAWFGRRRPLDLSAGQLRALLARDPDHRQAATLAWSWRASPWAHLVLLALGLPFALRFERRSSLEGIAVGVLLCALYFVADVVLRDLGGRGALSPWLAGTGTVLLFGSFGLWAFDRTPT